MLLGCAESARLPLHFPPICFYRSSCPSISDALCNAQLFGWLFWPWISVERDTKRLWRRGCWDLVFDVFGSFIAVADIHTSANRSESSSSTITENLDGFGVVTAELSLARALQQPPVLAQMCLNPLVCSFLQTLVWDW